MLNTGLIITPGSIPAQQALHATKVAYISIAIWGFTMTCIKASIALTLLRIPQHRLSKFGLYFVIGCQVTYFIINTMYVFTKCRPLRAAWASTVAGASCVDLGIDIIVSTVGAGINIATDLFLSIAPMAILWNLRRPLRERILVCALTGLGIVASLASIMKLIVMQKWGKEEDPWEFAMVISTWAVIEQFMAALAACSPSLKGPIQRALGRVGVLLTRYNNDISFIYMDNRGPCEPHEPHGPIYEMQADAEVGGYPGLIGGDGPQNQTRDHGPAAGKSDSTTLLTSVSRSTLHDAASAQTETNTTRPSVSVTDKG